MSKHTRKELERKARRELIVDAAIQVMEQKGFDNATMDDIAETAEVGKGTLYLYFENKISIYIAVCERASRLLNHKLSKVLLEDLPGLDMIEKIGYTYLEFIKNNSLFSTAFNYVENILDSGKLDRGELLEKCEEHAQEAMTYIVRALQIGMQDGSIKKNLDPKELGLVIWGASKGVVHLAYQKQQKQHLKLLNDVSFDLQSLFTNFIQMISSGIENDS